MAQFRAEAGLTIYALAYNASGQVYNSDTPGFEAYNAANYADYALDATEDGSSGIYRVAAISDAVRYEGFAQISDAPTQGDDAIGPDETPIRTLLATELARIDVATSSRQETLAVGATNRPLVDIDAIKGSSQPATDLALYASRIANADVATSSRQATFTSSTGVTLPATVPTAAQNASTLLATTNGDATVGEQLGTAGAGLVITPIVASASNPAYTTRDLGTIWQHSAPVYAVRVVDGAGTAVDLTGKTVRMLVASVTDEGDGEDTTDDTISAEYKYETGGSGLTVSDTNLLTIQHNAANTATVGQFRFWLWNTTDSLPLMRGTFKVDPAAFDV